MKRKLYIGSFFALILSTILLAASGTPNTIRVLTDATGALLVKATSQTLPLSQPTVFSNTRLLTDASNNLQVVLTGTITPTFPLLAPTSTDCTAPPYSFIGRTATGLNSQAANTWNLCGGGTLGLSGNTTAVTSSLPLTVTGGTVTTTQPIFNGTQTWNAGAVLFTGILENITNTASLATSLLIDLQVASVSKFGVKASSGVMNLNADATHGFTLDPATDGKMTVSTRGGSPAQVAADFFVAATGFSSPGASIISLATNGILSFTNSAATAGFTIDGTTDSVAFFKTRGGVDTATIKGNNLTTTGVLQGSGTGVTVANVGANSCGTSTATISGNQVSGVVTVGTVAGTQCRLTFTTAAPVARDCTVTDSTTTIATRAAAVDASNTDLFGAFVAGDKVTYVCTVR